MDLNTKTVEELKVIAYDVMVSIQKLQNDSQIINQLIAQKSQQPVKPERVEKKEVTKE